MRTEYWGNQELTMRGAEVGFQLEARASIALSLIEKWGTVAGDVTREDTGGRAVCELIAPQKLVDRCFTIADLFIVEVERRGAIKQDTRTTEAIILRAGALRRLGNRAEWEEVRKDLGVPDASHHG